MKNKLILATHNENKVKEFTNLFGNTNYEILSLRDLNYHKEIIEDGETFQDNALIKALTINKAFNLPVIADDSGLLISALDGFPGVESARFMSESPYSEKHKKINEMLAEHSNKSAEFICAIALVGLDMFPQVFIGKVKGIIVEPQGIEGFGYDPIFYYPDLNKTFAEISETEKGEISHRGQATKALIEYLNSK